MSVAIVYKEAKNLKKPVGILFLGGFDGKSPPYTLRIGYNSKKVFTWSKTATITKFSVSNW
jgi:hypothetical protein